MNLPPEESYEFMMRLVKALERIADALEQKEKPLEVALTNVT